MSAPGGKPVRRGGYLLAFGAATAYGTSSVLNRAALREYGAPLSGVTIALAVGLLAMAPLALRAYRAGKADGAAARPVRTAILFACASGLSSLLGFGSITFALSRLPVVVATPISSAYPLVTVALVLLFLRQTEVVSRRTMLGAALIVAGIILVALNRQ